MYPRYCLCPYGIAYVPTVLPMSLRYRLLMDHPLPGSSSPLLLHASPFVGVFQKSILTGLSSFGECSPQNGSETVPKSKNRPLGYPHGGPFVGPTQDTTPKP